MPEDNEEMARCVACDAEHQRADMGTTDDGQPVCEDCVQVCYHCDGVSTDRDDWWTVHGNLWCESCYSDDAWTCQRCEYAYNINLIDRATIYGDGWEEDWCEGCISASATLCDSCSEYRMDDQPCGNCGESEDEPGHIHNYSYKPNPVFHGTAPNNLYMGFELEMELNAISSKEYKEAASKVISLELDNVCYLKSDSSINGRGFELVTHPHTLGAYDKATALWDYIETLRQIYGARSYDTESCGLHVHISRSAFKSGAHTHRFLSLIYRNPKEMMRLAGRKNSRYAKFGDVYQTDEWGIPKLNLYNKIHRPQLTDRYSAVNTGNDYTLELRFFRGNMKREGVMAALELCHASAEYTRDMSVSDVKLGMLRWEWFADWVASNNGAYPNLYFRMSKIPSINLDNQPLVNA